MSKSQWVGNPTNRDWLSAPSQLVIKRSDVKDVFNNLNVNVNAFKVPSWQIVPMPDCFAYALSGATLLNSVVTYLAGHWFLPFAQFSVSTYGKEV